MKVRLRRTFCHNACNSAVVAAPRRHYRRALVEARPLSRFPSTFRCWCTRYSTTVERWRTAPTVSPAMARTSFPIGATPPGHAPPRGTQPRALANAVTSGGKHTSTSAPRAEAAPPARYSPTGRLPVRFSRRPGDPPRRQEDDRASKPADRTTPRRPVHRDQPASSATSSYSGLGSARPLNSRSWR
jgi:hypothetical protein